MNMLFSQEEVTKIREFKLVKDAEEKHKATRFHTLVALCYLLCILTVIFLRIYLARIPRIKQTARHTAAIPAKAPAFRRQLLARGSSCFSVYSVRPQIMPYRICKITVAKAETAKPARSIR